MRCVAILIVGVILLLGAVACTPVGRPSQQVQLSPEQTIERYFEALDEGNYKAAAELMSSRRGRRLPDDVQGNIRSARLIQLGPVKSPMLRPEDIAEKKRLPGVHDVHALWAEFEIEFYREQSMTNGRHSWNYILIKESADGPWVIDDWGH